MEWRNIRRVAENWIVQGKIIFVFFQLWKVEERFNNVDTDSSIDKLTFFYQLIKKCRWKCKHPCFFLQARDFATITTRQMNKSITYMAIINFDCKPVIYIYDEKRKIFIKLQQTDSNWTRDIEFLRMPNSDVVYLAVASNRNTAIYAGAASWWTNQNGGLVIHPCSKHESSIIPPAAI